MTEAIRISAMKDDGLQRWFYCEFIMFSAASVARIMHNNNIIIDQLKLIFRHGYWYLMVARGKAIAAPPVLVRG